VASPFRLLGQVWDEESGLSWTRFRCFDAATGRWLSADPLELAGGSDTFGFDATPVNAVDALGLAAEGATTGKPGSATFSQESAGGANACSKSAAVWVRSRGSSRARRRGPRWSASTSTPRGSPAPGAKGKGIGRAGALRRALGAQPARRSRPLRRRPLDLFLSPPRHQPEA
jgi:RHS repeat-associated protein